MKTKKNKIDPSIGRRMERDILRAIADYGMVTPESESSNVILRMYPDEGSDLGGVRNLRVTDLLNGMVDDGLLRPTIDQDGERITASARGLTTKGWERLDELERPVRRWIRGQWFPLIVASVTTLLAVANIISNFL